MVEAATRVDKGQIGGLDPADWDMAGTGDFNGDCKADVLWRKASNPNRGKAEVWLMDGLNKTTGSPGQPPVAFQVRSVKDYDRDGKSDILWHNTSTGLAEVWLMDGFIKTKQQVGMPATTWVVEE